jgi:hypothetical protein
MTKAKAKKTKVTSKSSVATENNMMKYLLILAALVLVLFWVVQKNKQNNYMMQTSVPLDDNNYPNIESGDDLNNALKEVDNNDPLKMDSEIKELDTESKGI